MTDEKHSHYRQFYDSQASYWDQLYKSSWKDISIYGVHYHQRREVIFSMLDKHREGADLKVLDAGCGPGAYIQPLLEKGYRVTAIDQSEMMVEKSRANFDPIYKENVTLQVASVDDTPFDDSTFSHVISVAVIMYVSEPLKMLKELARVLEPQGSLIMSIDNKADFADTIDFPARIRRFFGRRGNPETTEKVSSDQRSPNVKPTRYSPSEMRKMIAEAGFEMIEETSIGFAPILVNGRRVFGDAMDLRIDRLLGYFARFPWMRLKGYTYIFRAVKL